MSDIKRFRMIMNGKKYIINFRNLQDILAVVIHMKNSFYIE